jgi:hypothetical protein
VPKEMTDTLHQLLATYQKYFTISNQTSPFCSKTAHSSKKIGKEYKI